MGNTASGNPAAFTTSYTYDAAGDQLTVTDPLGDRTTNLYDSDRNVTRSTDANGHAINSIYDADNRLISVTRPDGSVVTTQYDGNGNVTTQTDGLGHTTAYTFDPLDRKATATDAVNRTTTFTYDGAGNALSARDAAGATTTYGYDADNRRTAITYSDGVTPGVGYTYDGVGQRLTMTDGTGTTQYAWDSLHRLTSSTNGAGAHVGYGYDLNGQLTSITYPGGANTVTRTYDDAGRLKTVSDWLSHMTTYTYDANSNLTGIAYPNTTAATYGYDNADRLTSITDTRGGTTFLNLTYGRDNIGQLSLENGASYGYDGLNRLTTAAGLGYTYDSADRLTGVTSGASVTTLAYDSADQLQTATTMNGSTQVAKFTYVFDLNGNRTKRTDQAGAATSYGWDQANRLVSYGGTATYTYNGDGLRMSKTVSGSSEAFTWSTAEKLPLLLQDGGTSYVSGANGLPLEQISGSAVLYYHLDQLGSTRKLTDSSGAVQQTYSYDGYGGLTGSTGSVVNPLRYTGAYLDVESGLLYLRARYYEPGTGQFISVDPASVQTRHRYAYTSDNPANQTDPSGLCGLNPFAGDSCLGEVANWVYENAGEISTVTGTAAALMAPVPGLDVLSVPLALVSVGTGILATVKDYRDGNLLAAGMDVVGLIPGMGALGVAHYGSILEDVLRETALEVRLARNFDEFMFWDRQALSLNQQAWRLRRWTFGLSVYAAVNASFGLWYAKTKDWQLYASPAASAACGR